MDSRVAPAGQLVYEDFEPRYQWMSGKDTDTVTVDLTGFKGEAEFKKEHLKVKIDNHGNLKVSGERPLGGGDNRWRRFQKVFRMAEDCITTDIKAKFDNGVLSVVMPKLTKDQPTSPPPPPQAVAATAVPPAKPEPIAAPRKAQVVDPADGKKETSSDKAGEPAAEKPSPPAADVGLPTYGAGSRRRLRRVMGVVVVVAAMVAAAVGLGMYYWSHRNGVGADEQLDMADVYPSEL